MGEKNAVGEGPRRLTKGGASLLPQLDSKKSSISKNRMRGAGKRVGRKERLGVRERCVLTDSAEPNRGFGKHAKY